MRKPKEEDGRGSTGMKRDIGSLCSRRYNLQNNDHCPKKILASIKECSLVSVWEGRGYEEA